MAELKTGFYEKIRGLLKSCKDSIGRICEYYIPWLNMNEMGIKVDRVVLTFRSRRIKWLILINLSQKMIFLPAYYLSQI